jgi:PleD family two-component response regulator
VALSIGVAVAGPGTADVTALLEAADEALYRAKAAGRRRAHLAEA